MAIQTKQQNRTRWRFCVRGAVQGIGFRPFVYRLAAGLGLAGFVRNTSAGVWIEVEGPSSAAEAFRMRLEAEKPERAVIQGLESQELDPCGFGVFEIRESVEAEDLTVMMQPDIATCPNCLQEVLDPANRRYRYPFTNCTHCGPRFSIIEKLPYDRPNTTMRDFEMCPSCRREYEDPSDRRFHAQPNACPECGPRIAFCDRDGKRLEEHDRALLQAAARIREGAVVAVKGIGGFHLMVRAAGGEGVAALRERKRRSPKPFALMYPSLEYVRRHCRVSAVEQRLLLSPEAPIVLLERLPGAPGLVPEVAPGNPCLGIMLPFTPLHHLLMLEIGEPVVATSGNHAEESIVTGENEAFERLRDYADYFLIHDRRIANHTDDSIIRLMHGREALMRRSRGFAPMPVAGPFLPGNVMAVGAHMKNTVAFSCGGQAVISQHIGDLESAETVETFRRVIGRFTEIYGLKPQRIMRDLHPDYCSNRYAEEKGIPSQSVQHHLAHVLACMAENQAEGPLLGTAWDGTGLGSDGTIWGGEFFEVGPETERRVASFRSFALPGGEKAVREPRRLALSLLYEIFGPAVFQRRDLEFMNTFRDSELKALESVFENKENLLMTSSAGRLFDAVSSLAGICHFTKYEGQAAMELEYAAKAGPGKQAYPVLWLPPQDGNSLWIMDWEPIILGILEDLASGRPAGAVSAAFHETLARSITELARRLGHEQAVLSGGCFQNRILTETCIDRLREAGIRVYWHQRIPPNDGGISVGQLAAAARRL